MDIAQRIKFLREAKKLRQLDIAEQLGIEVSQYNRWEKRGDKLSIEQIKQIATALGVTIKEVLFNESGTNGEIELQKTQLELAQKSKELNTKDEEIARLKEENAFLKEHANRLLAMLEKKHL